MKSVVSVEQVEFIALEEHLNQVQDLVRTPGFGGGLGQSGSGTTPSNLTSGTDNTGGGGGGLDVPAPYSAGNGGSGIVIIRYKFQ